MRDKAQSFRILRPNIILITTVCGCACWFVRSPPPSGAHKSERINRLTRSFLFNSAGRRQRRVWGGKPCSDAGENIIYHFWVNRRTAYDGIIARLFVTGIFGVFGEPPGCVQVARTGCETKPVCI